MMVANLNTINGKTPHNKQSLPCRWRLNSDTIAETSPIKITGPGTGNQKQREGDIAQDVEDGVWLLLMHG